MSKPYVAIVGRPNVGKSTLFNRIIGERRAVVSDIPGTTRDRVMALAEWEGRDFMLVDTGGIEILPQTVDEGRRPLTSQPLLEDSAEFIPLIRQQAEQAIAEADVLLFLTDTITGITGADREVAELLYQADKPILVVANKADNARRRQEALEFYELGLGTVYPISAIHSFGVADLLDVVVAHLPAIEEEPVVEDAVRIAFLGRPNVGKSTLFNTLLGQERAIVSPVPGTTRDALDTELVWEGEKIILIDTAGLRRRGKIAPGVERYSTLRTIKAAERSDVALLLLDGVEGITTQDAHIAGIIVEQGVSVVVLVNKWDAVDLAVKQNGLLVDTEIREDLKFMPYIPILFISALTGRRVQQVIPTALDVVAARQTRIEFSLLNDVIREAIDRHSPPSKRGRQMKLYQVTQLEIEPPTFIFSVNDSSLIHFSYRRYLENVIREEIFPFPGTPLRLVFRGRAKKKR
ncbi:MAG TPA: ribosome biogenesis GTPase Der [Thermoflexia bacterium]|nr:ribosome biogenesis GTPase Der [Thermoflexia bacterium]